MSDELARAARQLDRLARVPAPIKRALRPLRRALFAMHRDEAAIWVLERPTDPAEPVLDVLRFGACDFRETEHAHTTAAPVGWPRHMAAELERAGVALAFQNLFVWHFGDVPDEATIVKRRRRRRGRPDVIVIQTGGFSALRHVWGFSMWAFLLRDNLGRHLGRLMHPIWRLMSVVLTVIGRPAPWYGPEPGLRDLVGTIRRIWPDVPIEYWHQSDPVLRGFWDERVARRLIAEVEPVLRELNVTIVAAPPVATTMATRGANGANFNARGSREAGAWYARHLLERYGRTARSAADRGSAAAPREPSNPDV